MQNFSSDSTFPFASFNSKCNDKSQLTYDVIKSYQLKTQNDETYSLINHNYMAQYEKLYYGLVRINTPTNSGLAVCGIEYEVYQSGNTSNVSQLLIKGSITNTNVDCFTFPISDIMCDYFVKVTPSYTNATLPSQRTYVDKPKGEISLQDLRAQPQQTSTYVPQSYATPGEMLFGIFYTARVIQQRKDAKGIYTRDNTVHNYMTQTRLPRDFKDLGQIREFRDKDIEKIREMRTSPPTNESNSVEPSTKDKYQTDIRQFYTMKEDIISLSKINPTQINSIPEEPTDSFEINPNQGPISPEPIVPPDSTFIRNYTVSDFDTDEQLMYGFLNMEQYDLKK